MVGRRVNCASIARDRDGRREGGLQYYRQRLRWKKREGEMCSRGGRLDGRRSMGEGEKDREEGKPLKKKGYGGGKMMQDKID